VFWRLWSKSLLACVLLLALIGTLVGRLRKEIVNLVFKEDKLPFDGGQVQSEDSGDGVEGPICFLFENSGRLGCCGDP
jgi:hypothetical protein